MDKILSIIYVYYNTPDEIINSLNSLPQSLKNISYEVIIVDNASLKKVPESALISPYVKIIKNSENYGYGKGLNQGVKIARGKYVIISNPDVEFSSDSIKILLDRFKKDDKIGVIAPQLVSKDGKTLQSISGMPYLPKAIFIFSFLSRLWPNNSVLTKYHNINLDRNREQYVDVVGGACMMVKRSIFDRAGGFDERFFMYFEEADFCFRVKKLGFKILYFSKAKVVHLIGRSNRNKESIEKIFEQSRFKFFKKYHGLFPALFGEFLIRFFKPANILLFAIFLISTYLNFYKISERMVFIGDQGWFYLSARDLLVYNSFPLVGITASHTWLHQGPLWTYVLALIFKIFNFNPVAPGYFTAFLGTATVFFIYKLGKEMFSRRIGLISALLYSTSPLIILNSQMPYHTSFIPLLSLLFAYSFYEWIKGDVKFFPLIIFFLALLYNFELSTQILWFPTITILIFGLLKRKRWALSVFSKKIILFSIVLFVLPMLPIIIYDFSHNFAQTLGFFAWIPYKALSQLLNLKNLLSSGQNILISMFSFLTTSYQNIIFIPNYVISLMIFFSSLTYAFYRRMFGKFSTLSFDILIIFFLVSVIGIFINATSSGAHIPLLFPSVIFLTAWFFDRIMNIGLLLFPTIILIFFMAIFNSLFVLDLTRSKSAYGLYYSERLNAVKAILKKTDGERYEIKGKGPGSQFESFTMNYEYLAWWLGRAPSKKNKNINMNVSKSRNGIKIEKLVNSK
ncbi:glycosyltransferase [Candidatus Roizmanbacteria bacterium]|nr:glycosyltransferase [Candidatus Roizmanbacteria bacterium]